MNKTLFLSMLRRGLAQLPPQEIEKHIAYYAELIDDMLEDGMSEEEATARLGSVDDIVKGILEDTPLPLLVRNRVTPSGGWTVWAIILLALGSPLWLPLLMAVIIVAASIVIVVWALIICFFAVVLSLGLTAAAMVVMSILSISRGPAAALLLLGLTMAFLGLTILAYTAAVAGARGLWGGTKALFRSIKRLFIRREETSV